MITGISLKGIDAVLVGLAPDGPGRYRPITLGIAGNYNRLGSIDAIENNLNTELVLAYFVDSVRDGRLFLDPSYEGQYGKPPRDVECLLNYFERNVSESSEERPAAALSGQRIFSCLVARPIWDALAGSAPDSGPPEISFARLFGASPIATEIYRDHIFSLTQQIHDLDKVHDFLAARGLAWLPQDEEEIGAQHYGPEMREFLDTAKRDFADAPTIRAALDAYAAEVDDLLHN